MQMTEKISKLFSFIFEIDDRIVHKIGCFLYTVGFLTEYFVVCIFRLEKKVKRIIVRFCKTVAVRLVHAVKKIIFLIFGEFISPVKVFFVALVTATKFFLSDKSKYGLKYAFSNVAAYAAAGTKKHAVSVLSLIKYFLPALSAAVFIYVVRTTFSFNYHLQVILENNVIGYVQDEGIFESAKNMINERLFSAHQGKGFEIVPVFNISVSKGVSLTESQLADKIIKASGEDILQATGILINNELFAVVTEKAVVEKTLQGLLKPYQNAANTNLTVDFVKEVRLLDGLYLTNSITNTNDVINQITGQVEGEKIYIVQKGDFPSSVAKKTGVPLKDLYALNPHINPEINKSYKMPVGDKLLVSKAVDFLQIKTVERRKQSIVIPHETVKTNNENLLWGTQKVTVNGEDGIDERIVDVVSIDGIIVEENVISQTRLKNPVTEQLEIGTKNVYGGNAGDASSGSFIWPSPNYKSVSRGFGPNGHRGLDITGAANIPILAVDNAVVEFAGKGSGSYWSYGNYVRLRHSNGITTIYAHCNSLTVTTGQYVGKGQTIALMGSTGRSSGNHLHLEVQVNGVLVDPYIYVKRPR